MKESNENLNDSVRLLNGSYMSIDDYNERKETTTATDVFGTGIVEVSDNLPFEI